MTAGLAVRVFHKEFELAAAVHVSAASLLLRSTLLTLPLFCHTFGASAYLDFNVHQRSSVACGAMQRLNQSAHRTAAGHRGCHRRAS